MRIVFLSDDFPPQSFGGAGISTYDLAAGMKKAGHEVFVITTCRRVSEAGEVKYNGLTVFKIASDYPGKWRWYVSLCNWPVVRQVKKILSEIKPDIVHVNNIHFYLSYASIRAAKKYAKAVVWTGRDVMAFNFAKLTTDRYLKNFDYHTTWRDHIAQAKKRWNPLRNFFIKRYLNCADALFAVSEALKNALAQNGIKNVQVVHTGINVDLWRVDDANVDVAEFKKKYNLGNKKVILFGGRLSEAKGGAETIETLVQIVKEVPDAVLLVISKIDGHTEQLQKEAGKHGIAGSILFTGWIEREDIKFAYAAADVVLVPSICFDSLPRIVIEAMACAKPVVGTCYGGAPEVIEDGVTGYVVNPFRSEEMARKIIGLLKNPEKIKKFGRAGQKRIETKFNIGEKITDYVRGYSLLLNKNHGK